MGPASFEAAPQLIPAPSFWGQQSCWKEEKLDPKNSQSNRVVANVAGGRDERGERRKRNEIRDAEAGGRRDCDGQATCFRDEGRDERARIVLVIEAERQPRQWLRHTFGMAR